MNEFNTVFCGAVGSAKCMKYQSQAVNTLTSVSDVRWMPVAEHSPNKHISS